MFGRPRPVSWRCFAAPCAKFLLVGDEQQARQRAPPFSQRVAHMLEIIRANSENEAINVALIHSNEAGAKLRAEQQILEGLPPSVTATDLLSYGEFWRARNRLRWSFGPSGNSSVALSVPSRP